MTTPNGDVAAAAAVDAAEIPVEPAVRPSALAKLVDLKAVTQPPRFSGKETEWSEFRYQLLNVAGMLGLDEAMERAAAAPEPPQFADMAESDRQDAKMLFSILVAVCRGKAAVLLRTVADRNGMAAWHLLNADYQPRSADRQTALLVGLLNPRWSSSRWMEQLLQWETALAQYQLESGAPALADEVRVATVVRCAPAFVRDFLRVSPASVTQSYASLKTALKGFLQRGLVYSETGVPREPAEPMELDALKGFWQGLQAQGLWQGRQG